MWLQDLAVAYEHAVIRIGQRNGPIVGHRDGWTALHPLNFSIQPCPKRDKEKLSLHYQIAYVLAKYLLVHNNNNNHHVLNIYSVQPILCAYPHSILTWGRRYHSRTLMHLCYLELFLSLPKVNLSMRLMHGGKGR